MQLFHKIIDSYGARETLITRQYPLGQIQNRPHKSDHAHQLKILIFELILNTGRHNLDHQQSKCKIKKKKK